MDELKAIEFVNKAEKSLASLYKKIDDVVLFNQKKVLDAFRKAEVELRHMNASSGYGYEDVAKPKLSELFSYVFSSEAAIVSPLITCGTHALASCLFGILRPGDLLLSIAGEPYDTLIDCIKGENNGSLNDFGVKYEYIDLINGRFNTRKILSAVRAKHPKMIFIQRSRGYQSRSAISVENIEKIISKIREIDKKVIIMVDNCYGEFVEKREPIEVGADIIAGSLIKNPGGGIAPTGGYVAGRKDLIDLVAGRLTAPTLGTEVGSYNTPYTLFFEGLFIAPHVVGGALKGSALLGKVAENLGYKAFPKSNTYPYDIIRSIYFDKKEDLIELTQMIQKFAPVDSNAVPMPWDMPGYNDKVIMAAGSFIQGSSIELSCDAPIRKPYILYIQGGITYEHIKLVAIEISKIKGE